MVRGSILDFGLRSTFDIYKEVVCALIEIWRGVHGRADEGDGTKIHMHRFISACVETLLNNSSAQINSRQYMNLYDVVLQKWVS